MAKKTTKKKYRSAITGRYVKKKHADKNPKTTVAETDKKRRKKK